VDSLRVRLMLLAALALLPLAGLVFYNAEMQRQEAATEAEDDALRLARVCSNNEERMVEAADRLLAVMAEVPVVKTLDAPACGSLFERVLGNETGYANLGLLNAQGQVIASVNPMGLRTPLEQKTFFKQALTKGAFAVSDFELDARRTRAEMMCGDAVRTEDGRVVGVLFAELDLAWMTDLGTRQVLPAGVSVSVVNRNGIILMRVPDPQQWVGRSALEAPAGEAILERGRRMRSAWMAHGGCLHSRRWMPGTGWEIL